MKKVSLLGLLYHKTILYPKLSACLDGKVLDFGCGVGGFLRFRSNTVGVDINTYNIDYCKSLGLKAEVTEEGGVLPFKENSFAGVVIDNVIEHIPVEGVDAVIGQILRVLRPDGTIVVGVPGIKGYLSDYDHKVFYDEASLAALFGKYGWKITKAFHMPIHLPFLERYLSQYCKYIVFQNIQ